MFDSLDAEIEDSALFRDIALFRLTNLGNAGRHQSRIRELRELSWTSADSLLGRIVDERLFVTKAESPVTKHWVPRAVVE